MGRASHRSRSRCDLITCSSASRRAHVVTLLALLLSMRGSRRHPNGALSQCAMSGAALLEPERGADRDHRGAAGVDGVDDLGVVDPLKIDRGDAEVAVPELPLDYDERHALLVPRPCVHADFAATASLAAAHEQCAAPVIEVS